MAKSDDKFPSGTSLDPAQHREVVVTTTQEIGTLLRAARKEINFTQRQVAGMSNSGNRFIVDAEQGKPTLQAQKLIDLLGLMGLEVVIRKK